MGTIRKVLLFALILANAFLGVDALSRGVAGEARGCVRIDYCDCVLTVGGTHECADVPEMVDDPCDPIGCQDS